MRVNPKVKLATERAIRTSARKLFLRKGLAGTNTREIAVAAKVAAGTVFNYFPSKEALAVSIAAEAFDTGRALAQERTLAAESRPRTLDEHLFALIACDLRALQPIRPFIAEVLESALSPFATGDITPEAAAIRAERLEDAAEGLARFGLGDAASAAVMHLYWSLYLGVLSFWSADASPNQEDSLALLDRAVRMFVAALQPAGAGGTPAVSEPTRGADESSALEVRP